ncbi:unnamed protein product [Protopolystoma xenopodis]|uniref:Uncharacterized protein n=1 Tax=Protopolystoma xenopodis TaxID=117903 RepID=A0A3S5ATQ9_9PLAT|nr:unnamed protein product [Protopolystoma xenopodis]
MPDPACGLDPLTKSLLGPVYIVARVDKVLQGGGPLSALEKYSKVAASGSSISNSCYNELDSGVSTDSLKKSSSISSVGTIMASSGDARSVSPQQQSQNSMISLSSQSSNTNDNERSHTMTSGSGETRLQLHHLQRQMVQETKAAAGVHKTMMAYCRNIP